MRARRPPSWYTKPRHDQLARPAARFDDPEAPVSDVLSGTSASAALLLLGLALVPMALITLTSFAKIAVVLSALRNAIGAPDLPSGAVVTALALALSVYVMAPVAGR